MTAHQTARNISIPTTADRTLRESVGAAPHAHALVASIFCRAADLICTRSHAKRVTFLKRPSERMPRAKARAATILAEFEKAETELVGKAVALTDGKAGTVENVWLDEFHGLRIAIKGHEGKWPVSTIKMTEQGSARPPEQANRGKR